MLSSVLVIIFFIALAVLVAICGPPPRVVSPVGPGKHNHAKATTANKADQRLCRHLPELFEHKGIIPKMSFLDMKAGRSSPSPGVQVERWGAGVETQKNVRGEIRGWGLVPFNETYAPSLSTIYDGA